MNAKKLLIQLALLAIFFFLAYLISLTGKKGDYDSFAGFAQGTTYRITYENKKGENLQPWVDSLLADFDLSLSIYKPGSVISRINRNDPEVIPDDKFLRVFDKSREVYEKTGGAFDITVGPIVNAIGFGSTDTLQVDTTLIDSLRQYIGMDKVFIRDNRVIKAHENVRLDVNAIAQGYAVDLVAAFLESRKIRNYLVEIGGEVRVKGKNKKNQYWQIGIDKPEEGNLLPGANLQTIIALKNRSLATSGNYRKYYEKNGVKFVHTINPASGYPVVSNLLSATVVAGDCATADAYATALMVFGVERAIAFLNENSFLDAYLVYADAEGKFRVYVTPGLQRFIVE